MTLGSLLGSCSREHRQARDVAARSLHALGAWEGPVCSRGSRPNGALQKTGGFAGGHHSRIAGLSLALSVKPPVLMQRGGGQPEPEHPLGYLCFLCNVGEGAGLKGIG